MLKRLTAAALVALISTVAQPALARGKGPGSDKASTPAAAVQAQKPPKPGMVWVNTASGVYHRESSRYYGKTAKGEWMTEADAKAKGLRLAGSPGARENPGMPEAKAEKPGKPGAKPGKPGKADKPGKPDKTDKPGKPVNGH